MQGFNFTIHPNQSENHCRISIPAPSAPQVQKQTSSLHQQMPRKINQNIQIAPNPNVKNYFIDFNRKIGKGNFSTVYMAYDKKYPNVNLAVKVVNVQKLKQQNLQILIKSEVQVLLFMNHQNVLSCKDVFWDEIFCYIFTQFCQSGSLQSKIKKVQVKSLKPNQTFQSNRQQLQSRIQNIFLLEQMGLQIPRIFQRQMLPIISDIFHAMLYLEKAHIVHRDIKAANIFLKNNKAVVADFGFAKFYSQPFYDLNIGSLPFMPPEAITNSLYGSKTDVWAFGVLLYEIFHGESPYAKSHDMKELIQKAYTPLNLSMIRSDLSVQLKELILNCLQVDMHKRKNFSELQKMWYCNKLFQNGNITVNKNKIQTDYHMNDGRTMNLSITQAKKAQSVPITYGDKIVVQNINDNFHQLDSDRSFGSKFKDKINPIQNINKMFLSPTESPNKASKSVGKTPQISSFNDKKIVPSPTPPPFHDNYLQNNIHLLKPNQNLNGQTNFKISINGNPVNIGQVKQNSFINHKNQAQNSIQIPQQNYNLTGMNNFLSNSGHSTNLLKKGSQSSANSTTYNANPIIQKNESMMTPNQPFISEEIRDIRRTHLIKRQSQNITLKSNFSSTTDLNKAFKNNSGHEFESEKANEDGVKESDQKQKSTEKKVQNLQKQKQVKSELLNSSSKKDKTQANGEEEKTSLKETLLTIQQIRNFYKLAIILKDSNKRLSQIKNRLIIKSVKDINKVYETVENNKVDLSSYEKNRDLKPIVGEKKQDVIAQQANIASRKNKLIGIIKDYQNQFENQLKRRQLNNNLNMKINGENNSGGSRIPEFLTTKRDTTIEITSSTAHRPSNNYFNSYGFSLKSNNASMNNYKSNSHSLPEDIEYIVENQLGKNSNNENFSVRGTESYENYLVKLQEVLEDIMHVQHGFLDIVKNKNFQILNNSRKKQQRNSPENIKIINQVGVNRSSFGNRVLNPYINSSPTTIPMRNLNEKLDVMQQMSRLKWEQKNA